MLTRASLPGLTLLEPADLAAVPAPEPVARHHEALAEVVRWTHAYLCRPHAELGRQGPVCPYVPPSLQRRSFYLAAVEGAAGLPPDRLRERILAYRDWFLELEPTREPDLTFKTIVLAFPDLHGPAGSALVDEAQAALKPEFLRQGLMLGEFHDPPPDKPGLRNPDFRPLRSPVPLLVIRVMVTMDFWFLRDEGRFVQAYLARHGDNLPDGLLEPVREAVERYGLTPPPALRT